MNDLRKFLQGKVDASEILTTSQVRELAGCSKPEVYHAIKSGELPAIKLQGGHGSDEYILTADDVLPWCVRRQQRKSISTLQAITKVDDR